MKLNETKNRQIIEAAIEEFRAHGFRGAKTAQIAKRADVSSRTLYKHFPSKEDLFEAISRILIERNTTMGPVPYDPGRDLKSQLKDALKVYVSIVTEEETIGLNRMVNSELLRDLDQARAFYAEAATHDDPILQLITEAMEANALRKADPKLAGHQLLGLIKTFFFWPEYLIGEPISVPGAMDDCINMFLAHYDPSRPAD